MTRRVWMTVAAVAALGVGCAGARSAQASRTASRPEEPQAAAAQPGTEPGPGAGAGGRRMHPGAMMQCPMEVPGTQVSAAETPEGEAVTFTTSSPDDVPDLRARIHAMADRYERRHEQAQADSSQDGAPEGDADAGAGSSGSGSPDATPPSARRPAPSRAVVEDIEGGARIDITPNDPANVDQLRTAIRNRVAQMQETGSCAMGQPSASDPRASPDEQGDSDQQGSPDPQPPDAQ